MVDLGLLEPRDTCLLFCPILASGAPRHLPTHLPDTRQLSRAIPACSSAWYTPAEPATPGLVVARVELGPLHCEWSLSHWTMREVTYEGVFSYWISYRSSLVPSSFFFSPNKKCSGLRRALSVRFCSSWLQQKLVFEKQEWWQLHHQLCSHDIHMTTSLNALLISWGFSGHLAESWASYAVIKKKHR